MGILSGSSDFDRFLDKATSQLQLEPDWAMILQICDCIRQEDVTAKYAVAAIKKKIFDPNPHVAKYALTVLEACVKNCGSPVHKEVATKQFVEELRNLLNSKTSPEPVKEKVLELIQIWSQAFRNEPKYKIVQDTYNLMKIEGHKFPTVNASDAMFIADTAPEWAEGDVCNMCRVKFGMVQRQHHCRNCGQVFCGKCSAKTSIIPQYGIEREVRVCDPCYYKLNPGRKEAEKSKKSSSSSSGSTDDDLPAEYLNSTLAKEPQLPASQRMSEREIKEQEEDELQLAMALSLSEGSQDSKRPSSRSSSERSSSSLYGSARSPQPSSGMYSPVADVESDPSDMDPELARYLNRSYWEDKRDGRGPATAAPPSSSESSGPVYNKHGVPIKSSLKSKKKKKEKKRQIQENGVVYAVNQMAEESTEENSDALVSTFKSSVEMLLERMQACSSRGKHIAMDSSVQSLFQTISAMHPQLLRLIEEQEQEKAKYEALQEKLGLVKEARVTLDAMRNQHREKVRQQELEQDMLRRIQIEQKLELMRQQKADYLAYQKRLEAERQLVLEQQQQQLQQQMQYRAAQQYPGPVPPGGGSPYSSLTYIPPPPPGSAPGMQAQIAPPQYPQSGQMPPQGAPSYQAQEAQAPPQYSHGTQGYNYPMATDKGPYMTEYPESQPPTTVEYSYGNQQQQPQASYPANLAQQQYQQQQQPIAPGTVTRTTAPSPPQYGQVTAQQQPQPSAAPYGGNEYQPGGLPKQQQQFSPPRTQTPPPPPQYPSQPSQQQQLSQMPPPQQDPPQAQYQPPPLEQEIPAQPMYTGALSSSQQQQPMQGDYAGPPPPPPQSQQQLQPLYQQGPPPPQYPGPTQQQAPPPGPHPQQPMQQYPPPGQYPSAAGQQFPPPGQQPSPQGQQPPPTGQQPPPPGQQLPPPGHQPPPPGHQPPPPGHQPPLQGQQVYGPPEGQYASYQHQPPQQQHQPGGPPQGGHPQGDPPPQRQLSDLLISFD